MSDLIDFDSAWPSSVDDGPFKAERHDSGWWIITNASGNEVDDSGDGGFTEKSAHWIADAMNAKFASQEAADEITALREILRDARGCLIDHLQYMKEPESARIIKRIDAHLLTPESDNG
ncbi:hypothetical protein [Sphingopyxis macrogoltabida]|uniref:Uncharacterized protein n=1 Tax=Sphingopyxis macrogoltabida TaxID=33050 RepID=A0AAC8Z0Z8_SPHMC|nr:hypothetical protein [Sphingopyxis macrogoltabida]ALJ12658.1 hypothetical protein LH19_07240 [Sphingopyxis macrogoltabida]AMU89873.1 hypothetical protein ATM17_12590 [Sphingopyxis macrogoltabida]